MAGAGDPRAALAHYDALVAKVDAFAARVTARHARALACRRGCSSCCHQHLSVLPVEFARVAEAVRALDDDARAAMAARLAGGVARAREDPRCPLLDDAGACRIYTARPLICRTHGLPIQIGAEGAPREGAPRRDVCPLNFTGAVGLEDVPPEDVLDVDRLNATLVLVDRLGGGLAAQGTLRGLPLASVPVNAAGRVDLFEGLGALLDERGALLIGVGTANG